ncbi:SDR family oxidoreductase [Kribbella solani]|uniref:SDR family NAD(P)-dependent oxidoreductase n=1 Tax=Kribbella solani TaxID=236067 RepID=UPI0029AF4A4C|nr:SDR family oxidoreductase [Kribbella solani]MDX2972661.1 SDR family oxidoreductase [Kribbella solani]MDX3001656.1 SDR family oxidoreductase [Kribbella solani]
MQFDNQVVAVTGAAQGIGRAVAEAFAAEGAKVAVVDVRKDLALEVVAGIADSGGQAMAVECNVASRAEVNAAAREIASAYGPIEVLVSNAGITRPAMLRNMADDQWRDVLAVHLDASFYWLQAVVEDMVEMGHGRIIFSSSSTAQNGSIGQVNYAAAKAGILGLMRSAARELGRYGILVNAVAPSAATEMTEKVRTDPRFAGGISKSPLRRWAEPDEIAPAYLFLAGSASSFMTGQVLSVDGGNMLVR